MKKKNIGRDVVAIFDWILCVAFALLSLLSLALLLWSSVKATLVSSVIVLGLLAIAYSPLVKKPLLVRVMLSVITIFILAY